MLFRSVIRSYTQLAGFVNQGGHLYAGDGGNGVLHFDGAGCAVQTGHVIGTEFIGLSRAFFPGYYGYVGQERTADFLEYRQHGVRILGGNTELFGAEADGRIGNPRQGFHFMFDLCRADGAVQIDQAVHPFYIVGIRHTAFAVCQAFAAEIAILFMGIAGGALAVVRMTGQVHCVGIGRIVVHQFVLAVVVGCAIVAAAASVVVIVVVIVPMIVSVVMSVVVIVSVVVVVTVVVIMVVPVVVIMAVVVIMSVVMIVVMVVVMVVVVVVVMVVVMIVVMIVIVSQPFSVRMSRYMVVVMYVVVSMLLYDSFYSVFLHCIHMLHYAAPFCKGTYCGVFRTAADVFQISDFFCHFNSPFLAPEPRDRGTVLHNSLSLISLSG